MNIIYGILGILASLGGLFAWIYQLIKKNQQLTQTVSIKDAEKRFQEWSDQIKTIEGKVNEDERDYEQLKKDALNGSNNDPNNDSNSKS